jgi:16S rRNA (guanine527-N7)-methyltransferase
MLQAQINTAATTLGLALSTPQIQQLSDYLLLLHKWNAAYNLSALKTIDDMLVKHVFDCLAVVRPIAQVLEGYDEKNVLDVGTGAGLPGLVLAICVPEAQITMLDAVQKKITFVRQVIGTLGLHNAAAHGTRVQDWSQQHSIVAARAWTALGDIPKLTAACVATGGRIVAMKGPRLELEAQALPNGWGIEKVLDITVPQLLESRCLAILKREND